MAKNTEKVRYHHLSFIMMEIGGSISPKVMDSFGLPLHTIKESLSLA